MSELEVRCLDAFPVWLQRLGKDALLLAGVLEDDTLGQPVRRRVAAALNYLFKSLDLIPDGIDDLGFVDDAFVFRVAAAAALGESGGGEAARPTHLESLGRLAGEAELIQSFLGSDYARLVRYVADLDRVTARGRSVEDILASSESCAEFRNELSSWAESYTPPSFGRDEKNLVKLKAFLATKLPA